MKERMQKIFGLEGYLCAMTVVMVLQYLILFPQKVYSVCNAVIYLWGAVLLAAYFIRQKPFLKSAPNPLLFYLIVLFFFSTLISILINWKMNPADNLTAWFSSGLQVFFCCYCIASASAEKARRLFSNVILSAIFITLPIAVASLVMCLLNIRPLYPSTTRFTGLFFNPNNAFICAVSLILSALYLLIFKKYKKLMILNILLQASVVGLAESRALYVLLLVFGGLVAFGYAYFRDQKKIGRVLLRGVSLCICFFVAFQALSYVGRRLPTAAEWIKTSFGMSSDGEIVTPTPPPDDNREDENKEQSNAFRVILLESGVKTFAEYPIFGVGPRNIAQAVQETVQDERLNGIEGGGLHNMYLQVLVSTGAVGMLLFLALAVGCCVAFFSAWKRKRGQERTALLYAFIAAVSICCYGLFEANLLFANTLVSVAFWSVLGYMLQQSGRFPSIFKHGKREEAE